MTTKINAQDAAGPFSVGLKKETRMKNVRSTLGAKAYWVGAIAGIILLAVLANVFFTQEQTNGMETRTGKIITASLENRLSDQRLRFIANQGQAGAGALYHVQGAGHTVLFHQDRIVLRRTESASESNEVVLQFEGANSAPVVEAVEKLPGVAHFYKGSNPDQWHTNVPTYGAVFYKDLYPGIDMAYIGDQGTLESEFYLAPGADYHQIKLHYQGVKSSTIREDGALVLDTELGELVDASGFFDILAGSTSSPGRADRFQYKLTIEDGERQHTAEINESAAPDSIRPLLRRLTTLARGQ